jgi:uncharacterized SAM-binding protein YcdF (DUF218 family)
MLRVLSELLLLPPASALLLFLIGTALRWKRPRPGKVLQAAAGIWLCVAALPCTGGALLGLLQTSPPLPSTGALPEAQAIVVLAAEADTSGAEYGGAVAGALTMQRLRYGAWLQRRTGLPMLTSGGVPATGRPAMAALMARAATEEFGVPVRFREERSATTRENAAFSVPMLRDAGVHTVLLVTSAWHMPRAALWFRNAGIDVVPAPTGFRGPAVEDWTSFVPRWTGLRDTCLAIHEFGGLLVYAFGG